MKALITGASSGIGKDMAKYLGSKGFDLIITGRNLERLEELKKEIKTNVEIIAMDLSINNNCIELYNRAKGVDVLINNAGFGLYGEFVDTDLEKEINMINTNITAVHILTKLFLKDMVKENKGYILNVASIAGYVPGPLMSTYYSTKAYVLRLTQSIQVELKKKKSKVKVSALCPGPIKTNFFKTAGVRFLVDGVSSKYVAEYAIDKMLKGKKIIVPTFIVKVGKFFCSFVPDTILANFAYNVQKKRKS